MAYWFRRRYGRRRRRRPVWRRRHRRWRRGYRRARKRWRRRPYGRRRRRGRRRRKVRFIRLFRRARKRVIRQWEPNAKTFCKITGTEQGFFWGINSQHRIMCDNQPWPIRTGEGEGGSMNIIQHTLFFLYNDNKLGKNHWTRSNANFDLCKYHGTKMWFARHPYISYIVIINRDGHFYLDDNTYQNLHPEVMYHAKKKIIVYSQQVKPKGKAYIRIKVPPPQLLKTQWYFQRDFCKVPLFTLLISAFDPVNNIIAGNQSNSSVLLYGLPFYSRPMPYDSYLDFVSKCWGPQTDPWCDRQNRQEEVLYLNETQKQKWKTTSASSWALDCTPLLGIHYGIRNTSYLKDYEKAVDSVSDDTVMKIALTLGRWKPQWPTTWRTKADTDAQEPFSYRYSWREDLGTGNKLMLYTRECRDGVPEADNKLEDLPLYMIANGYLDFIKKHSTHNPLNWVMVVWCPYTYPKMEGVIPLGRDWFKQVLKHGENKPRNSTDANYKDLIRDWNKTTNGIKTQCKWETAYKKTFNAPNNKRGNKGEDFMQGCISRAPDFLDSEPFFKDIYLASPFSFKLSNTTGSVFFTYQSLWSWGGDFPKQKPIENPCNKPKWGTLPIATYDSMGVQIEDPSKNTPKEKLHTWDLRRGDLTKAALKRLMELDSPDSEPDHSPQRKKRRPKEPLTAEERIGPEDVFLYLPSPEKITGKDGKDAKTVFKDANTTTEKLAETLYQLWDENQHYRHRLRDYLRKQRDRDMEYRLLLG
nr:ORF1 [Epsilontorquevirus sp.]